MTTSLLLPLAAHPSPSGHGSLHGAGIVVFIVVLVLIVLVGGLMALRYVKK